MYKFNEKYLLENMEQIISQSYYGDELFFTDYKKAAINIMKFLENENVLRGNQEAAEIHYHDQIKAA